MSTLEIALSVATICFAALWLRSVRKQMIVRHLFIQFSDWTAIKIASMVSLAVEQEVWKQQESGNANREDAMKSVNYEFLNAADEWAQRVDGFQASLKRNGMSPLSLSDKDGPIMESWISGYKH